VEALEFSELIPRFEALGARVYGLSRDVMKSHAAFIGKKGLRTPLLSDPELALIKALGAWGVKKAYGRESEGVVRSTVLAGPGGVVAKRWPKASSAGHAAEVLAALEALAGKQAGRG
jgi:peroxiredoxin Q/BCP